MIGVYYAYRRWLLERKEKAITKQWQKYKKAHPPLDAHASRGDYQDFLRSL